MQKLTVVLAVIVGAVALWMFRHQVDDEPSVEVERLQEAQKLTVQGFHVSERVKKIEAPALTKSTPTFKITAETPKIGPSSVSVNVLGSRTENGNLVISGEAWAIGDRGQKLFGGKFERVEALEAIIPRPARKSWAVGPAASFGPEGWMFGASVASPVIKVLLWEPRLLGTMTTNGKTMQGSVSVLFEL